LTGQKAVRNNRSVRKALAMPAAVLAAAFLTGTATAETRVATPGKHVSRGATPTRKPALKGGRQTSHSHPGRARTVIRQNPRGQVVAERVQPAQHPGPRPATLTASLPAVVVPVPTPLGEFQNYPPAPCLPVDFVIEAHVHPAATDSAQVDSVELAEQADEGDPAAEVSTAAPAPPRTGARASLGRMAARVGSLFRPKSDESQMRPRDVDLTELVSADFLIPVEGVDAEKLRDSFLASRGRFAKHLAIDIGAPRGTPILATTDGEIVRTAKEKRGGNSIYQKDATGQYLLFYCHLSRYAADLAPGRKVKKGEVIGYVGSTGHVIGGPHLHFSITRVPQDVDDFRKGLAINPYLIFLAGGP
jgi:hypothetical protein